MAFLGRSREREMYFGAKPNLFKLATIMRSNPTDAENVLWKHLKKFRLEGFIFRRQHAIDIFIADFYCHKLKLVIEVDGEIHLNQFEMDHDDGRTGDLEKFGITVIRFKNEDVLKDQSVVISQIRNIMSQLASAALLEAGDGRG